MSELSNGGSQGGRMGIYEQYWQPTNKLKLFFLKCNKINLPESQAREGVSEIENLGKVLYKMIGFIFFPAKNFLNTKTVHADLTAWIALYQMKSFYQLL